MVKRTDEQIYALVDELIGKMTLEEKIGQLSLRSVGSNMNLGLFDDDKVTNDIRAGRVGCVIQAPFCDVNLRKRVQKAAAEESRLGIPLLFNADVIHGFETEFPVPIATACSFDMDLIEEGCKIHAEEGSCVGVNYTNAPMVEVSRDPRWGRVVEGSGEDPYLAEEIARARVRGFQNGKNMENLDNGHTMISAVKHYVGYSAAEAGRDYNTCEFSDNTLYNFYLRPFKAAIEEGAASIMSSFNTINNEPVSCSKRMLKTILRDELGFKGITVSDANSLYETIPHGYCESKKEAAYRGLKSTMSLEMGSKCYEEEIENLLNEGTITMEDIDENVRYNLYIKYKCGIMDNPYQNFDEERQKQSYCEAHLDAARRSAAASIVMTKNNGVLPVAMDKKIALIGPFGTDHGMFGAWWSSPRVNDTITMEEGLTAAGYDVVSVKGCEVHEEIEGGIEEAVKAANDCDVVLLALGEKQGECGEAAGKRDLNLTAPQLKLAEAIKATGKPVVLLLTTGRPMIIDWFDENVDGILITWFLGTMAGHGIADVVSGKHNPSAKLCMSFPRHVGQIPVYYNHQNTGRPTDKTETDDRLKNIYPPQFCPRFIDGPWEPLYTFGEGLSYSKFEYSNLEISADTLKRGDKITVSVDLTNTSDVDGTETVQLYLRDLFATAVRPVKELIGFKKVAVKAGETVKVSFDVTEDNLKYYDAELNYVAENGEFRLFIGGDSKVLEYATFKLVD